MKRYLSSHYIGDHGDRLTKMCGGLGARMAIIANALDYIPLEDRLSYTRTKYDPVAYFLDNGFDPSLVDLREYFGRPDVLRRSLKRFNIIWFLGVNVFLLRRAMRASGFDDVVEDLLNAGTVYAGWSAGACVAGQSLEAVALMDAPDAIGPGYSSEEPVLEGLGLVPFTILPHFQSDHPEAAAAERAVAWATEMSIKHVALRDGEVIVRNGAEIEVLPRKADDPHTLS